MVIFFDLSKAPTYRYCRRCRTWFGDGGFSSRQAPQGAYQWRTLACTPRCEKAQAQPAADGEE